MWPAKWNAGKVMFFLTRYPVFLDVALNLVGKPIQNQSLSNFCDNLETLDLIQPNLKLGVRIS